jgi:hypothetical protein
MRVRSAAEDTVLASDDYYTEKKIVIGEVPAGLDYDLARYISEDVLLSGTVTADLENPLVVADLKLSLGLGTQNLSPYITGGLWVNGRPLFDPGRYLTMFTRTVGRYLGALPAYAMPWRPMFSGRIDTADPGGEVDTLGLVARDWYSDWMDIQIEPQDGLGSWQIDGFNETTQTGGDPSSIFAQLLDLALQDWIGPTGQGTITIVGDPGIAIPTYMQDPGSLLLALRSVALLNGWDMRGRWNALDQWVLTHSQPDRSLSGPQLIFGPRRQYAFQGLAKSRDEVRNRVAVTPADPPRTPVIVEDKASQDQYGKKYLGVAEDQASRIKTPAQALALALAILADTKQPKIMAVADLNYQPLIEINDVLRFPADNILHDGDLIVAVSGYTHTFGEDGSVVTRVTTRDLPAAANAYWRREEPKMSYSSFDPPSGFAAEGARWTQRVLPP